MVGNSGGSDALRGRCQKTRIDVSRARRGRFEECLKQSSQAPKLGTVKRDVTSAGMA